MGNVKVFVPTKGVIERIRTTRWLLDSGADYYFVCHTDEDRKRLYEKFGIPLNRIIPCNPPFVDIRTIGWIRDWIVDNLTNKSDWYCMIDDNTTILKPPDPWYQLDRIDFRDYPTADFRELYRVEIWPSEVIALIESIIQKCIDQGTVFGGMAIEENYYFRSTKWTKLGFIRGKFCVSQNNGIPWQINPEVVIQTDIARSVDCVARYGSVVINRFCHPESVEFSTGGVGTLEYRQPFMVQSLLWLRQNYRGLIVKAPDKDWQVKFLIRGKKDIQEWREENGWI